MCYDALLWFWSARPPPPKSFLLVFVLRSRNGPSQNDNFANFQHVFSTEVPAKMFESNTYIVVVVVLLVVVVVAVAVAVAVAVVQQQQQQQ